MKRTLLTIATICGIALGAAAQEVYERPQGQLTPETPHVTTTISYSDLEAPMEQPVTFTGLNTLYASKDYTLTATIPSCATNNLLPLTLNVGKDVKAIRYLCVEGDYSDSESNFDIVAEYGDAIGEDNDDLGSKVTTINMTLEMTTERSSRFTLLIVGLDKAEKGSRCVQLKAYFYTINDDDSNWQTLGSTYYVDDIVANMYSSVYNTSTYVSVQEHKYQPGYYRIVNPYGTGWSYNYKNQYSHTHKHYIYIHAEDPNKVYLDESPIGANLGHGGISVASMATPGFTTGSLTAYYGKMEEHVITFPAKALLLSMQDYNSGKWFRCNSNAMFRVTIPPSPQTITWDQTFPTLHAGDVLDLTATASSGLEVTYTLASSAIGLAELNGNRLTLLAPGTITVSAWQQGDNKSWAAAPTITRQIICLPPDGQTITWNQTFDTYFVGDEVTLNATATSGLDVEYSVDDTSLATVEGNKLTLLAPGTVTVTASQPGNGSWSAAQEVSKQVVCTTYTSHDLFVIGPFNDWQASEQYMLTTENDFLYTLKLPANTLTDNGEPIEWCISNANGTIRFGRGDEVPLGGSRLVNGGANNISNIPDAVTIILFLDDECWTEGAFVDMTILSDSSLEGVIPETLGVMGDVQDAEWNMEMFPMLHKEGNTFSGSVTLTGPRFILCEHGITTPDDYTTLGTFYGPEEGSTSIEHSVATTFVPGNSEEPFVISNDLPYPVKVNFAVDFDNYKLTVTPGTDPTGVLSPVVIDTNAIYYNLQGLRVERPTPGLYIVVRDNTITKQRLR